MEESYDKESMIPKDLIYIYLQLFHCRVQHVNPHFQVNLDVRCLSYYHMLNLQYFSMRFYYSPKFLFFSILQTNFNLLPTIVVVMWLTWVIFSNENSRAFHGTMNSHDHANCPNGCIWEISKIQHFLFFLNSMMKANFTEGWIEEIFNICSSSHFKSITFLQVCWFMNVSFPNGCLKH